MATRLLVIAVGRSLPAGNDPPVNARTLAMQWQDSDVLTPTPQ